MSRSEKRKGGKEVCKFFLIHQKLSYIVQKLHLYIITTNNYMYNPLNNMFKKSNINYI